MRPRFLIEPEAEAELEEAFAWYEERVPGLGSEFTRAVRAVFATSIMSRSLNRLQ